MLFNIKVCKRTVIIFLIMLNISFHGVAQDVNILNLVKDSVEVKITKKEQKNFLGKVLYALTPEKYKTIIKYEYVYKQKPGAYLSQDLILGQSTQMLENEQNKSVKNDRISYWDSLNQIHLFSQSDTMNKLSNIVYGYHPYWCGSAYKSYNFSLLSRVAFFGFQVDPLTGSFTTIHDWPNTEFLAYAHRNGCKVDICITNFDKDNNAQFLNNDKAQISCINNIIIILKKGGGDGVNIDFEGVALAEKEKLTDFIHKLAVQLKQINPSFKLTMTIPAIDREGVYDIKALSESVNLFILMAYDYYGKNSMIAGPSAPLYSGKLWPPGNIDQSVARYISSGVNPLKLLLGVPYFGKLWTTQSSYVPSATKNFVSALSYKNIRKYYQDKYPGGYDTISFSKAFVFNDGKEWNQLWSDDEKTLAFKYDYVKKIGIAGVAIWALGYDNGYSELWKLIKDKFSSYNPEQPPSAPLVVSTLQPLPDSLFLSQDIDSLNMLDYILTLENEFQSDTNFIMAEKDPLAIDQISRQEIMSKNFISAYRSITFAILLLVFFSLIGFVFSLFNYQVREQLFSRDIRRIVLAFLCILLIMIFLQICNIIKPLVFVLLIGIIAGILIISIIVHINKRKKTNNTEITP
jgi:spore germination protein YaaH